MRTKDWYRQAEKDLQHAKRATDGGDFEWACFAAQQAAEKAVKSLYKSIHVDAVGQSVSRMLQDLPSPLKAPQDLVEQAKELEVLLTCRRMPDSSTASHRLYGLPHDCGFRYHRFTCKAD